MIFKHFLSINSFIPSEVKECSDYEMEIANEDARTTGKVHQRKPFKKI